MDRIELVTTLQAASDRLFGGLNDKPRFRRVSTHVRGQSLIAFSYETWSPMLHRVVYDHLFDVDCVAWMSMVEGRNGEISVDRVEAAARLTFERAILQQHTRFESARLLGLIDSTGFTDLELDRMSIDRTLADHLVASGVSLANAAAALRRVEGEPSGAFDASAVHRVYDERNFVIAHTDVGVPVVSSWLDFHSFHYNGAYLDLKEIIPEIAASAYAKRRLGDLVDTGRHDLNRRRILSIAVRTERIADPGNWGWQTRIALEPDLIEMGSAPLR